MAVSAAHTIVAVKSAAAALSLVLAVLLSGCDPVASGDITPAPGDTTATPGEATELPAGAVSWTDARASVGSSATVCGPVIEVFTALESSGRPTFVDIGSDYPDPSGFTVVIWDENLANFPTDPAAAYSGAQVCASGDVYLHEGYVQIEAVTPSQLTVLD